MIALPAIKSLYSIEKTWVLSDQLLVSATSFITMILLARSLATADFGWYAYVVLVQLLALAAQNAIFTGPYQVLQGRNGEKDRNAYLGSLFFLQGLFTVVLLTAGVSLFYFFQDRLGFPMVVRGWLPLAVGGFLLQDFVRRVLLTEGHAKRAFFIDALANLPQTAILLYLMEGHALQLLNCFQVIGITFIPSILLGAYWLPVKSFDRPRLFLTLRLHLSHGKWLLFTALLQWWSGNFFTVAAGLLLGVTAFAALRLAQGIFGVLNVVLQAIENYAMPRAVRIGQQSDDLLCHYLKSLLFKTAFFFVPFVIGISVFARPVFRLAGGQNYLSYYTLIPCLSLLYLFVFLGYPIRMLIRVRLLNRAFFLGYLLSAFFSLLFAKRFIGWWGENGVVAGLIATQLLMLGYWLSVLKRKNLSLWK